MGNKMYRSNKYNGFIYDKRIHERNKPKDGLGQRRHQRKSEDDLIIEENTVYEIDRECYERLMRQKVKER